MFYFLYKCEYLCVCVNLILNIIPRKTWHMSVWMFLCSRSLQTFIYIDIHCVRIVNISLEILLHFKKIKTQSISYEMYINFCHIIQTTIGDLLLLFVSSNILTFISNSGNLVSSVVVGFTESIIYKLPARLFIYV